ncbi:MAG: hypothetical protein DMG90_10415, partial [Acidobacteria bacterium]
MERSVGVIKSSFWAGVRFTDIDHLNDQAKLWCDRLNQKVHRTTLIVINGKEFSHERSAHGGKTSYSLPLRYVLGGSLPSWRSGSKVRLFQLFGEANVMMVKEYPRM